MDCVPFERLTGPTSVVGYVGELAAPLAFIIRKEKSLVFLYWAAKGPAKLILLESVPLGGGLQQGSRVGRVILQIVVSRPMEIVCARLRDDVDDPTERSPVFRSKSVVYHTKFADCFL